MDGFLSDLVSYPLHTLRCVGDWMSYVIRTDTQAQVDNFSHAKHYSYKRWEDAFKKFMTIGIGLPDPLDKAVQRASDLSAFKSLSEGKIT